MEEIVLVNQSAEHLAEADASLHECNFQALRVMIRFFTSILDKGTRMYERSKIRNKMN